MNRPTRFFRPAWPILLLGVGTVLIADPSLRADNVVVLNHTDGSVTPFQTVELSKGDSLSVTIIHTQRSCTTYSISAKDSRHNNLTRFSCVLGRSCSSSHHESQRVSGLPRRVRGLRSRRRSGSGRGREPRVSSILSWSSCGR